ncbi:hypothetical protein [Vulcanisaeta thermophila]|uniref:hypothetical protein n=1 Tax=Vulcanisaeta thermophila TaxID=867917 RepID=UPI0008529AEB|nr:hypothetical protein [Vulcanisaeta thermophila]
MDPEEYIEVGLGDVLKYIREIRTIRDSVKSRLRFKVPSEYVIEGGEVYIRPYFTDGFAIAVSSSKRPGHEEIIWWSHLINALNGKNVDWANYSVKVNGEVQLDVYDERGERFVSMRIDKGLIERIEGLLNAAFILSVVDWFIEDNLAVIVGYPEDYTKLRFIGDFVEDVLNELRELSVFNELVEGVRRIETECALNNHPGRDLVNVIPVGRFYLCPECLRRAESFVDEALGRLSNRKITISRDLWERVEYSIDYARDLVKSLSP